MTTSSPSMPARSALGDAAPTPASPAKPAPARARPGLGIALAERPRIWVRPLAALLLSLGVVLLALASERLLSERANDYLLLAWLALWLLLFAGCLLLAGTTRRMAQRCAHALDHWARRRAQARAEARFMALAKHDARLQAELRVSQDGPSVASD